MAGTLTLEQFMAQKAAKNKGQAATSNPYAQPDPNVWWPEANGTTGLIPNQNNPYSTTYAQQVPQFSTGDTYGNGGVGTGAALTWFQQLSKTNPKQYQSIAQDLYTAGLLGGEKPSNTSAVLYGFNYFMGKYATLGYNTNVRLTPPQLLALFAKQGGVNGNGGASSSTSTSYTQYTPEAARGILNTSLKQYLGREATAAETSGFLSALNADARANATVSTSSSDGKGHSTSTSINKQTDPGQLAEDQAKSTKGYANYQAATTFMSVLHSVMGNAIETTPGDSLLK